MIRLSFSQLNLFHSCPRRWYNKYVLKLPDNSDMCYANAGNGVHKPLDYYYGAKATPLINKKPNLAEIKACFNLLWTRYRLDNTKLKNKKDLYWAMVIEGLKLNLPLTSSELQIYFKDFVCYIDGFDSVNKIIYDWKTSTRSKQNEEEYTKQLICYSWMIYRKFGWIPNKCVVYYLKYSGTKGKLEFTPTMSDIKIFEEEVRVAREQMEIIIKTKIAAKQKDQKDCNFFCGYKGQCFGDSIHFNLQILGNNIFIQGHKSPLLTKGLDQIFSYTKTGSDYIAENSNWDGVVKFFNTRNYFVPIGFKERLITALNKYCSAINVPLSYEFEELNNYKVADKPMCDNLIGITLRDYQNEAADKAISKEKCLLHLCTRSGKTEIGAEIIRRLNCKTLWLTQSKELFNQSKKRLEKRLGCEVGVIQGPNLDIKQVTIAMAQTMSKRIDFYAEYLKHVDLIIVDECHHAVSTTYTGGLTKDRTDAKRKYKRQYGILELCYAKYRIGLSGSIPKTPETMKIESQLGQIALEIPSKFLIDKGYLSKPKIIIKPVFNEMVRGDYKEVYNDYIIENDTRNRMIADICIKEPGFTIVIVNKIKHGEALQKIIPNSIFINGELKDKEREQIMIDAKAGKIKTLIGTVLKEGVDLPNIENVVYAGGEGRSIISTTQGSTRGLNKFENKEKKIFDFYDKGKYIKDHSDMRIEIYKKCGEITYEN